jgi:tetratricopeptide (TPR) repeat protein
MAKKIIQFPGQVERRGASSLESNDGIKGGSSEDEIEGELDSAEGSDRQKVVEIRRDSKVSLENPAEESKRLVALGLANRFEARRYFKEATEIDKTNAEAFYRLGTTYVELDNALAEKYFIHALNLDPSMVNIYYALGNMYEYTDESRAYFYLNLFLRLTQRVELDEETRKDRIEAFVRVGFIRDMHPEFKK